MRDFKEGGRGEGVHSSCLEQKYNSFIQSMENNDNLMKKNLGRLRNAEKEGGERKGRRL